ncbi:hypothetical protein [Burkholderia ubonensis]|uniref:hypothetical protein n=1 Tax=Burkholderia ubonensis TaxID=101571 RepID=UPI0018E03089|nr:hypothetical protein [Burkholderia ubonensis]
MDWIPEELQGEIEGPSHTWEYGAGPQADELPIRMGILNRMAALAFSQSAHIDWIVEHCEPTNVTSLINQYHRTDRGNSWVKT